jgi:predicted nucleic acid-binding Zn ribbon protein
VSAAAGSTATCQTRAMGWRPLPSDQGPAPVPVGAAVERVLRHLGAPKADTLGQVFGEWEQMVGAQIAAHAEPVEIVAGRLVVRAEDPAWGSQLRWLEQDLVARLNDSLGPGVVTSIEVRVGVASRVPRARPGRIRRR